MKRLALLAVFALLTVAASPSGSFTTTAPLPDFPTPPKRSAPVPAPTGYTAAPLPNQDADAPQTRASSDASIGPGIFSRRNQYRGEGFSPNSSAQIEQERRARPGGGISLTMPLQ